MNATSTSGDHPRPGKPLQADSRPSRTPAVSPRSGAKAALEALAAALDPGDHTAELVTGDGPCPYLLVASRHAQLNETICADDDCYWWPWGQPIAAVTNPQAAAAKISYVLAATPTRSHG